MRRLLLILALVCGSANAVPPCWPADVGGSGTAVVAGSNNLGQWFGWWCPDGISYGVTALHGYTLKHPPGPHSDAITMLRNYWQANVVQPERYTDDMRLLDSIMREGLLPSQPALPTWKVAPNATITTRPTYTVRDGALVLRSERANVGDPCNCAAPHVQGANSYCRPSNLPDGVTLCRKD